MTYQVTAPEADFTGLVAGCGFTDGVAIVDESNRVALAYFTRRGYAVQKVTAPESAQVVADGKPKRPAGNASKADWQAYALALGFDEDDVAKATTKDLQELTKEEEK